MYFEVLIANTDYEHEAEGRASFSLNMQIFLKLSRFRPTDRPTDFDRLRPTVPTVEKNCSVLYLLATKLSIDKRFSASESHIQ